MVPALGFVVLDLWAKKSGKCNTTSRVLRQNKLVTTGLLVWGVWHIFFEEANYE